MDGRDWAGDGLVSLVGYTLTHTHARARREFVRSNIELPYCPEVQIVTLTESGRFSTAADDIGRRQTEGRWSVKGLEVCVGVYSRVCVRTHVVCVCVCLCV